MPKSKNNTDDTKTDEPAEGTKAAEEADKPEVLELVLETVPVHAWESIITVPGDQIVNATVDQLVDLQKQLKKMQDKKESTDFSEIQEVQEILRAKPLKRDKQGKLENHPQGGMPYEVPHDLEDQRPINRILWAIEDQLKGRDPMDVKKITIKFHSIADLKRPKYADALYLCKVVKWGTDKNVGIGMHYVDFAMKFNHIRNEEGELIEDDEARPTLKTQATAIISQSK